MPYICTRYSRTTHYPDGSSRSLSQAQEDLWQSVWPVGCAVHIGRGKTVEEIHAAVVLLHKQYRLKPAPHPTKVGEILRELEKAKLIESKLVGEKE